MRRLVLVRHGESHWNAEGRIQGQACAGLSDVGHAQAEATAEALVETYPEAHLVASDLQRTRETAAPFARVLERDPVLLPALRERSFGAWEGRLRVDVMNDDRDRWERWLTGQDLVGEIGGESADDLAGRVCPALRDLLAGTPLGGVTIAITHGGPVWHGTHRLLGLPTPTLGGVTNASVTEFLLGEGGSIVLDRWNEVAHLPRELRTTWRPSVASAHGRSNGDAQRD